MAELCQRPSQLEDQPTNDGTAFSDGNLPIDDYRCEPQRMHIPQFLRAKVIGVPLPLDNLVRDLEFLL